jgi:integrase
VRQQLSRQGESIRLGPVKTKAGRRSVSLDHATVAALLAHREAQQQLTRQLGGPSPTSADLVFARPDVSRHDPDVISQTFERLVAKAGLRRIRFHDLRHTHATLALQAGIHAKVVQERLGHSSINVTIDLYSHAIPALQEDAADRIAALVDTAPETGRLLPLDQGTDEVPADMARDERDHGNL